MHSFTVVADDDLKHLFDDNPDTCVSTVQLLTSAGFYTSRLNFTYTKNHGSISLKVTWNSDINCMRTKVCNIFYKIFFLRNTLCVWTF